ncbi:MAG: SagB/ThcOx family dehydrogenase [Blastocatellia bacterium]|nr:SagB/ThcOx family dehydrogenase [Blastocatellia bacterium]
MLRKLFSQLGTGSREFSNRDQSTVFHYHSVTKHRFEGYARSLGYLDWETQPDPFRRFYGAELLPLKFMHPDDAPPYSAIFGYSQILPEKVSINSVSKFFELSLALSAWKEIYSTRWSLRINPSSGNLHPTEGYLLIGSMEDGSLARSPKVCHYQPSVHALEVRAEFSEQVWQELMKPFPEGSFLVGLSSIHWREAWKYGERAFRYCQHDTGHAIAAIRFAAATLGWSLVVLEDLSDDEVAALLGISRSADFKDAEPEHPDLIALVVPKKIDIDIPLSLSKEAILDIEKANWQGKANRLSPENIDWEIIGQVAEACRKPKTDSGLRSAVVDSRRLSALDLALASNSQLSSSQIIKQRRSAVNFDAMTEISAKDLYRILSAVVPAESKSELAPPWDAVVWPTSVHLCLFVHRIVELLPGLYILLRDSRKLDQVKAAMRPDLLWQKPPECPEDLPLYFLMEGNCQQLAKQVSCWQDIAADGVFSLGMVAEFEDSIDKYGSWYYRRLFWETGMIGQVLYLEAEAIGIRSTGIGCFFDDPVHEIFGFEGWKFQSLYHFTMGKPVEDTRLTTLPAYSEELKRNRV